MRWRACFTFADANLVRTNGGGSVLWSQALEVIGTTCQNPEPVPLDAFLHRVWPMDDYDQDYSQTEYVEDPFIVTRSTMDAMMRTWVAAGNPWYRGFSTLL